MNVHFQNLLPLDFHDQSRVWIYQSNRQFTPAEALHIEELLAGFTSSWTSHGAAVKGFGKLFFGYFIILMADETATGVSGCSTDGSVRLIKKIEEDYNVSLFNRQTLAFIADKNIHLLGLHNLEDAISKNLISPASLYFDNTVQTKQELSQRWIIPMEQSWLKRKLFAFQKS